MTLEEIRKAHTDKMADGKDRVRDWDKFIDALKRWREGEAVEFAVWVKTWWVIKKGRYIHKGDFYNQDKTKYSTQQLYTLFIKHKNK